MAIELVITFDGDTPGIAAKTLSLHEFGKAVKPLLQAVRGSAARLVQKRVSKTRIGNVGEAVDLRLTDIGEGSLPLTFGIVVVTASPLLGSVDERDIAKSFINDVAAVADGRLHDVRIRNYLKALPRGVTHKYVGQENSVPFASTEIGIDAAEDQFQPSVRRIAGAVETVRVHEGKERVTFKAADGEIIGCAANAMLIEQAFALRYAAVEAVVLCRREGNTLLSVAAHGSFTAPDDKERLDYILETWDETLRRLAK